MKQLALLIGIIGLAAYHPHPTRCLIPGLGQTRHSWDSTKNWKIYKLQNFDSVFRIPPDSLGHLENMPLNDDTVHSFLLQSSKLGAVSPLWMGCYLASYEDGTGHVRKAIISQYGAFFYCQSENTYFQISPDDQYDWLNYLSKSYVDIPEINSK